MTGLIRLQFAATPTLAGRAIRWFSDSEWNHVDAIMPEGGLLGAQDGTFAGVPSGVRIRPEDYAPFIRTLRVAIDTPQADSFYAALRRELGKPYDTAAVLAFVIDQDRDWRRDDAWFCSQLIVAKAEESNVFPHRFLAPAASITPGGSLIAFNALPGFHALS